MTGPLIRIPCTAFSGRVGVRYSPPPTSYTRPVVLFVTVVDNDADTLLPHCHRLVLRVHYGSGVTPPQHRQVAFGGTTDALLRLPSGV